MPAFCDRFIKYMNQEDAHQVGSVNFTDEILQLISTECNNNHKLYYQIKKLY